MYSYMGWRASQSDLWGGSEGDAFLNNENGGGFLDFGMRNQRAKDYWTPSRPLDNFARLNAQGPTSARKPHFYANRSFVRLDNLSVAYALPSSLVSRVNISAAKVFCNVRNIGTIQSSEWTYGDPENQSYLPRTFTFGVNVSF